MFNQLKNERKMNKEERKTGYQIKNLLLLLREETRKDYLKMEIDRLLKELEKSLD